MNFIIKHSAKIQFISAEDAIDLRSRILRPGQPLENCHYPGDHSESALHLGICFDVDGKTQVLCNGTFLQESHANWPMAVLPYRLRGMATDTPFNGQGLGRALLEFAQTELKKRNCDLLWFNARTSALGFYEKLGFSVVSDIFEIPGAGPHRVMFKWLK